MRLSQHFLGPLHRALTGADGHQHPSDVAHHVMQEGPGADIQHNHLAVARHPQVVDFLDRRLGLALPGTEGAEVMHPHQMLRGFGHAFGIQRAVVPGDLFIEVRRADLIVIDHVAVTPGDSLETRVKMRRHDLGPADADVMGQIDISPHHPRLH